MGTPKSRLDLGTRHRYLIILPIILCPAGVALIILREDILSFVVNQAVSLGPTGQSFDAWHKTADPLIHNIYLFNWTNSEDFYNLSVKPAFEEIGPYNFKQDLEKVNIVFNDNDTVSYNVKRTWQFDRSKSIGDLSDKITSINAVALTVSQLTRDWHLFLKSGMSMSINSMTGKYYQTRSVGELLFDGYHVQLIELGNEFPFLLKLPPAEKFGWMYGRNASAPFDGYFNMGTGGTHDLGTLYQWNNSSRLKFFGSECNKVNGSGGNFFRKKLTKDRQGFFYADICRSLIGEFTREVTVQNLKAYEYNVGEYFFDNGTKYPENKCYCTGECVPSGAINNSACHFGSPIFMSLPHFYQADPYYSSLIDGMKPTPNHTFTVAIEPTTGVPLKLLGRLQLNVLVQSHPGISMFQEVPKAFFPILWFQESMEVPESVSSALALLLMIPWFCIGIGILFLSIAIGVSLYVWCKEKRRNAVQFEREQTFILEKINT